MYGFCFAVLKLVLFAFQFQSLTVGGRHGHADMPYINYKLFTTDFRARRAGTVVQVATSIPIVGCTSQQKLESAVYTPIDQLTTIIRLTLSTRPTLFLIQFLT